VAFAADNALIVTPGAGVTMRTIDVGAGVQGGASVPIGVNGASAWGTAGTANANVLTVQGIASMTPLLVTATVSSGTVTANQGGAPWTVNPGTAANWGIAPVGATAPPANAVAVGFASNGGTQFHMGTLDTSGNLNVNVAAGGGSGGTSSTFGSAFPGTGTAVGASDGASMQGLRVSSYGTSPGAVNALAVNANITNVNANNGGGVSGTRALSTGSSPVVQPAAPSRSLTVNASTSSNATSITAAATIVFGCQMGNVNSTPVYLHIFNKASAPTPGTDSAVKTLIVPGNTAGAGSNAVFGPGGMALATGFGITITGGIATIDNTTIAAANTVVVSCDYE